MKTKIGILILALCTIYFTAQAQRMVTTTRATSYDISDNLDLDAVASIFGDSENLEDFENRLNDPENRISNLDLNNDGYIDYLRVLENSTNRNSLVVIQAILDRDVFQDVATIEIERIQNNNLRIQIIGDSYIYGSNYIIEPVFLHRPLIFSFFWGPHYRPWISPYYWNYYPRWYSYYRPYSTFKYNRHIHVHINRHNKYLRSNNRNIHFSEDHYNQIRRNDYASRYPDRAFTNRQQGVNNKYELIEKRSDISTNDRRNRSIGRSNTRVSPGSQNSESRNIERRQPTNEYRRQDNSEKSAQTKSSEYTNRSNASKSENNVSTEQRKVEQRKESVRQRPARQDQSVTAPKTSSKRVESGKRSDVPEKKSTTVSNNTSQKNRSERKTETPSEESKKETEVRRRR